MVPRRDGEGQGWTFLTNHAHVLLCLAREPEVRMRDVAVLVGVTERAVQRLVADLEAAGYIRKVRRGRRNSYRVVADRPLRHPLERHRQIASLIALVWGRDRRGVRAPQAAVSGSTPARPRS